MNWLSEDELTKRLAKMGQAEPREEFVDGLERLLVKRAKKINRHKKFSRATMQGAGAAAAVLLALFITNATEHQGQRNETVSHPNGQTQVNIPQKSELQTLPPPAKPQTAPGESIRDQQQAVPQREQSELPERQKTMPHSQNKGEREQVKSGPAADARAELLQLAQTRLQQLVGKEEAKGYQVQEQLSSYSDTGGDIVYTPVVKGIPYLEETYRIGVAKESGVSGMSITSSRHSPLSPEKFPEPSEAMPLGQAEKIFSQHLRLVYVEKQTVKQDPIYGKPLQTAPSLQYVPMSAGGINAKTGQVISSGDQLVSKLPQSATPVSAQGKPFAVHSIDEVQSFITSQLQFAQAGGDIQEIVRGGEKVYIWDTGSITTDASSGRVLSFEVRKRENASGQPLLSEQQAVDHAIQFLQQYLKPDIQQLFLEKPREGSSPASLRLRFLKGHQGIPVIDHAFEVEIDRSSGKIVSFAGDFGRESVLLPEKTNVVSTALAARQFLQQSPLSLAYIWPNEAAGPQLVYTQITVRPSVPAVDAHTGEMIPIR